LARVNFLDPGTCPTALCSALAARFGAGQKKWIHDPTGAVPTVQGWRLFDPASDVYNYQSVNYLVTPSERISLFANGERRFGDTARAYFQATYVNRRSSVQVAPAPFATGLSGVSLDAANPYNPFGVTVDVSRRLVELPGRQVAHELGTFRLVTGLDGTLPLSLWPLGGWSWELSFTYGRTSGSTTLKNFLNTQSAGPGLGPGYRDSTGAHCGTPSAPIAGCAPVDILSAPGGLSPAMLNQLGSYTGPAIGSSQLVSVQLSASGELFRLLSGRPVGIALGFEHRNESGDDTPDPITAAGWNIENGQPWPPIAGHFYANEGYAEVVAPIASAHPGFEELEVQAAVRAHKYSSFDGGMTYKLGARWTPVSGLTLRATWSTAYKAPDIYDLYSGQQVDHWPIDPCAEIGNDRGLAQRCGAAANNRGTDPVRTRWGGNPGLQPETGSVVTAGLVLEPAFLQGFSLTADYFRLSLQQVIGGFGWQQILDRCYGAGTPQVGSYCRYVTRDPVSQQITDLDATLTNIGEQSTSGFDLAAQYQRATEVGRFGLRFAATYRIGFDETDVGAATIQGAGNYDLGLMPRLKFNVGVSWSSGGISAQLFGRYLGGSTECGPGGTGQTLVDGPGACFLRSVDENGLPVPSHRIAESMTWDAAASYVFKSGVGRTGVTLGIRNLFDSPPPRIYSSFLTYADPAYDFVGRAVYARCEHRF
jgi:outer membrane receptor protein involved in Fe transport